MEAKPFWHSKTFWVNLLGVGAIIAQQQFGYVVAPQDQMAGLAVINVILRGVTKGAVTLK